MTWVDRQAHPKTLVDFEELSGWTLELHDGATGELPRRREQQMWGMYVCRFWYSGTPAGSHVVARPPKPIPIPERLDSIELWGYGNRWGWVPEATTPPAEVAVLVCDARGREFTIQLAGIHWKQWWLIHRRVVRNTLEQIVWPASFTGIEISRIRHTEPRYLYCDSLAFFTGELRPLEFKPQPQRNLIPFRQQIPGLNVGPRKLPFPTREQTILPENFEPQYRTRTEQLAPAAFRLVYDGRDTRIAYEYRPVPETSARSPPRSTADRPSDRWTGVAYASPIPPKGGCPPATCSLPT
ncbi:MAG: hypothetical protein RMI94_07165 [Bryobacterales bacterium]|nr:hypothetical protein [Bryobacteraceae bacterium]MDW8130312.1 hypothetical protein [Bryobacterales bacterium]